MGTFSFANRPLVTVGDPGDGGGEAAFVWVEETMYAFRAATGDAMWTLNVTRKDNGATRAVVHDGHVYVQGSYAMYIVDFATGVVAATVPSGRSNDADNLAVGADGRIVKADGARVVVFSPPAL